MNTNKEKNMDDPNYMMAERMGYIPESDNELDFKFRSKIFNYGVTTVPKTQIRILFENWDWNLK